MGNGPIIGGTIAADDDGGKRQSALA